MVGGGGKEGFLLADLVRLSQETGARGRPGSGGSPAGMVATALGMAFDSQTHRAQGLALYCVPLC